MLGVYLRAFAQLVAPANVLFLFIGIVVGIVLGITPGLAALIGISQVMTMIWDTKAVPAVLLLCAIHTTVMTGGSVPAVLVGIPGVLTIYCVFSSRSIRCY